MVVEIPTLCLRPLGTVGKFDLVVSARVQMVELAVAQRGGLSSVRVINHSLQTLNQNVMQDVQ